MTIYDAVVDYDNPDLYKEDYATTGAPVEDLVDILQRIYPRWKHMRIYPRRRHKRTK